MKRNRSRKRNSPGKARTSDPRQVSLDQWLEDNADSQGANSGIVFRQEQAVRESCTKSEVLQLRRSSTKYLTRRSTPHSQLYKATLANLEGQIAVRVFDAAVYRAEYEQKAIPHKF
ncbi:hypothetical protein SNK03_012387 [Fusarium graminearum]